MGDQEVVLYRSDLIITSKTELVNRVLKPVFCANVPETPDSPTDFLWDAQIPYMGHIYCIQFTLHLINNNIQFTTLCSPEIPLANRNLSWLVPTKTVKIHI